MDEIITIPKYLIVERALEITDNRETQSGAIPVKLGQSYILMVWWYRWQNYSGD
jgi:hypothetical protein